VLFPALQPTEPGDSEACVPRPPTEPGQRHHIPTTTPTALFVSDWLGCWGVSWSCGARCTALCTLVLRMAQLWAFCCPPSPKPSKPCRRSARVLFSPL
jgi:hypothetical protein